jgi:hypothetical protein
VIWSESGVGWMVKSVSTRAQEPFPYSCQFGLNCQRPRRRGCWLSVGNCVDAVYGRGVIPAPGLVRDKARRNRDRRRAIRDKTNCRAVRRWRPLADVCREVCPDNRRAPGRGRCCDSTSSACSGRMTSASGRSTSRKFVLVLRKLAEAAVICALNASPPPPPTGHRSTPACHPSVLLTHDEIDHAADRVAA